MPQSEENSSVAKGDKQLLVRRLQRRDGCARLPSDYRWAIMLIAFGDERL